MKVPRIMISGERSGVGKSTITIGILAALAARGLEVQPFKAGPDFLDPMHHNEVSKRISRNLDTWMFPEWVPVSFQRNSVGADVNVVEGVMGLYDGLDGRSEEGSSSHLSKQLGCPVILVVDASSSSRSVGAVAKGFKTFDPDVDVRGVIFNNVSGEKHLEMVEQSIEGLGLVSIGGMPRNRNIELESRHLGLVPATEQDNRARYDEIREMVEDNLHMDALIEIARNAPDWRRVEEPSIEKIDKFRLGVARDEAFNFYYEDNFDILKEMGGEIVNFSPVHDDLPDADGYYFGGGYPELHLAELAANESLKDGLRKSVNDGIPAYAECGGLMYFCKEVRTKEDGSHHMTGIFDAKVEMTPKLQAVGYVEAECKQDCILSAKGGRTRGHVFHFSQVTSTSEKVYAYELSRNKGIDGQKDGFTRNSALASYMHLHFGSNIDFAEGLARSCLRD
ncbi:MAG: cobyrinic acid a,c-diamide synthase [Methanomassiliicoccales archaeon PtaU1.Bin124]|nr:MAG: cobyrinic acid a,c-diamide synthase [Methanomassiliicoccales archaeon PtaU1.Bin124]